MDRMHMMNRIHRYCWNRTIKRRRDTIFLRDQIYHRLSYDIFCSRCHSRFNIIFRQLFSQLIFQKGKLLHSFRFRSANVIIYLNAFKVSRVAMAIAMVMANGKALFGSCNEWKYKDIVFKFIVNLQWNYCFCRRRGIKLKAIKYRDIGEV